VPLVRKKFPYLQLGGVGCTLLLAHGVSAMELDWSAPEGCSEDGFVQSVEDNIQRELEELALERITVTVTELEPSDWMLEFSLSESGTDTSPSRTLTGSSCSDVSRAGAVAAAMAIHSRISQQQGAERALPAELEPEPSPAPDGGKPQPGAEPSSAVAEPTNVSTPGPPYHFPIQLLVFGDVSLLGTPSYGLGAAVGVLRGRWEAGLSGAILPKVEIRTSDTLGMRVGASLGTAFGCLHLGGPPAFPRACLGYELGVVTGKGSGSGFRVTRQQEAVWHALRPELGLGVPLGSGLELRLLAGAAIALGRSRFVFDAGRVGHETPRVSARGSVGLTWVL